MSNGDYLLDTSAVIALLRREPIAESRLRQAAHVFLPVIAYGELRYGVLRSHQPSGHQQQIETLLRLTPVLPCNSTTAAHYAELKHQLAARGTPIPENDLWIAALARQHALPLLTNDRHFDHLSEWIAVDQMASRAT